MTEKQHITPEAIKYRMDQSASLDCLEQLLQLTIEELVEVQEAFFDSVPQLLEDTRGALDTLEKAVKLRPEIPPPRLTLVSGMDIEWQLARWKELHQRRRFLSRTILIIKDTYPLSQEEE